ncbi:MAG: alpha/beta fold hydrolase [Acetobacteraceae bacterium]
MQLLSFQAEARAPLWPWVAAAMILHATETGQGSPIALLHGLFGAGRSLGPVQRRLAGSFRVIALDLRNHGTSPHAFGMDYPAMATDVAETLAARAALPASLLGHSMGGKVAMRLALERGELVRALVVADIAPVPYPPHHRDLLAAMQELALSPGLTRAAADAAIAGAVPDARVRGFLLQNLLVGANPSWRIGLSEIAAAMPALEDFPELPAARYAGPALFVAGGRSDYLRPELHSRIRTLFPQALFATLTNAGHWLHADDPAGFLAVVAPFLSASTR